MKIGRLDLNSRWRGEMPVTISDVEKVVFSLSPPLRNKATGMLPYLKERTITPYQAKYLLARHLNYRVNACPEGISPLKFFGQTLRRGGYAIFPRKSLLRGEASQPDKDLFPFVDTLKLQSNILSESIGHHELGNLLRVLASFWASWAARKPIKPSGGEYDIGAYCHLCWRTRLLKKDVCFEHQRPPISTQSESTRASAGPRTNCLENERGFHAELNLLQRRDASIGVYDRICFGDPISLTEWLYLHRPKTYTLCSSILGSFDSCSPAHTKTQAELEDVEALALKLLYFLDAPPDGAPRTQQRAWLAVLDDSRRVYERSPMLNTLMPIAERCEAWLVAKEQRVHGGRRKNAGRKSRSTNP